MRWLKFRRKVASDVVKLGGRANGDLLSKLERRKLGGGGFWFSWPHDDAAESRTRKVGFPSKKRLNGASRNPHEYCNNPTNQCEFSASSVRVCQRFFGARLTARKCVDCIQLAPLGTNCLQGLALQLPAHLYFQSVEVVSTLLARLLRERRTTAWANHCRGSMRAASLEVTGAGVGDVVVVVGVGMADGGGGGGVCNSGAGVGSGNL